MKNVLTLLLLSLLCVACSSDDDNNPQISSIKIENIEGDIFIGSEYQLKVSHTPADLNAPAYTWESSNPDIATVDNTGKIKALKEGQTSITVTAATLNLTSTLNISVLPVQATSIKLDKQENEMTVGESFTLIYKIEPENTTHKNVSWKSSDENIATLSKDGVVNAVSDGEVTITISLGELKDECKVKINPVKVTGIALSQTSERIEVLESFQLDAVIAPANAKNKNIIWKSSDEDIATVDNNGNVSTRQTGSATITATSEDGGFTDSAIVDVYNFTENIRVSITIGSSSSPWGSTQSTSGVLQNGSQKTIKVKRISIYESGVPVLSKDLDDTVTPGSQLTYKVDRHGDFSFIYEYEFNGQTYSVRN